MKISEKLVMVALAITALTACGGGGGDGSFGGGDPADVSLSQAPAFVQEYAALFNAARSTERNCGAQAMPAAPPLTKFNLKLQASAQSHADDMMVKGYYAHKRRDGKTPADFGYTGMVTAENLSKSADNVTPSRHTQSWLSSSGHCMGIMNEHSKTVVVAKNGLYTVMVYGD